MKIIVLKGNSNIGKTTTLNIVYDNLINQGGLSTNRQTIGNPNQNDFSDIVDWKNKKIAFYTMGDYSTYLKEAIYCYEKQKCDILVCAISTNNPKVRANKALNEPRFNTNVVNKQVSSIKANENSYNQSDSNIIINLL